MGVLVTAYLQQRGTGARDEVVRESRVVEVSAASYDDAKRQVIEQLDQGWIVASWRVGPNTA